MNAVRLNASSTTYGLLFDRRWKTVTDEKFSEVLSRKEAIFIDDNRVLSMGTIYHRIPVGDRSCQS